jgi:hypothetical protein
MDIGCRKVAVSGIRRETPGFAIANDALPVQLIVVILEPCKIFSPAAG